MGYTHYWRQQQVLNQDDWKQVRDAAEAIIAIASAPVVEESDLTTPPVIDGELIRFNGVGDDGHETFYFERTAEPFAFCKTAQKPYDVVVVAILTFVERTFPGYYDISSDGGMTDWAEGARLLSKATGLGDQPLNLSP